jgi:methyl-accepting chemotaxis protein
MDREVQAEFDEMRDAHRRAMERMDKADARAAENHRRAMERMDRAEKRAALTDKRMEKFDQQLQAMRKLVEAGIKIVSQLAADARELKRSQKAFLDSLRHAGNGRRQA